MEKRLVTEMERLLNSRQQNKRRSQVIRGLALLVVVATISALMMPAITMSNEVECGLDEHIHDESCYAVQQVAPQPVLTCAEGQAGETVIHTHDSFCYDSQGNLICTLPEVEAHTHGPECYQERRTLICQEVPDPGHQHSAACYSYVKIENADPNMAPAAVTSEYICGMQEGEGAHRHTDSCYPKERTERLVCAEQEGEDVTDEEGNVIVPGHHHDSSCYVIEESPVYEKLICTQEESEDEYDSDGSLIRQGHRHDDSCWLRGDELCFQEGCRQHESAGHQHTDACVQASPQESIRVDGQGEQWEQTLICQEIERESGHVHTDECYEITQVLACQKTELESHTHDAGCYDESGALVCGKPEVRAHQHTEACFTTPEGGPEEANVLICGKEEHTHTDLCYVKTAPEKEKYYCGLEKHTHTAECYFESGALRCTIPEHYHTDDCLVPPSEQPEMSDPVELEIDRTFEWETAPYHMTIQVTGIAVIPGQAVMTVEEPAVPMADRPVLSGFLSLFMPFLGEASATGAEVDEPEAGAAVPEPTAVVDGSQEPYDAPPYNQEEGIVDAGQESGVEDGVEIETPEAPDPDRIEFSVEMVSEWDAGYQRMAEQVQESGGQTEELSVFRVVATLDEVELDLSRCTIKVEAEFIEPESQQPDALSGEDEAWTDEFTGEDEAWTDESAGEEDGAAAPMSIQHTVVQARRMSVKKAAAMSASQESTDHESDASETLDKKPSVIPGEGTMFGLTAYSENALCPFTVEYYAILSQAESKIYETDSFEDKIGTPPIDSDWLPFIDTSAERVESGNPFKPDNGVLPNKLYLTIDTEKSIVKLNDAEETEIFSPSEMDYNTELENGGLGYEKLNHVVSEYQSKGDDHYDLKKIQVGHYGEGTEGAGTDKEFVVEYIYEGGSADYFKDLKYTNNPDYEGKTDPVADKMVVVQENTVIRMVYAPSANKEVTYPATFFDYDITDGSVRGETSGTYDVTTKEKGIHSTGNYSGTGTKLAFGNRDSGTGLGELKWNGNLLNMGNYKYKAFWDGGSVSGGNGYKLCTFGLARGVTATKDSFDLQFATGVDAPNLFGDANGRDVTGRTVYNDHKLVFNRVGDTYTLTGVLDNQKVPLAANLDQFTNPSGYTHIWTNNFWPMDNKPMSKRNDPNFGGKLTLKSSRTLPSSDDGIDHNPFFGMKFSVEFRIPAQYVGPLDYYFYGDDDMWVFLSEVDSAGNAIGKQDLVCDIGGVHTSVGEYVNLWDYIAKNEDETGPADPSKTYRLYFFYTERGASGSTCWMQFTLPNMLQVPTYTVPEPKNTMSIEKRVEGTPEEVDEMMEQEYWFELTLTAPDFAGTLSDTYDVVDEAGTKIAELTYGKPVQLKLTPYKKVFIRRLRNDFITTYTLKELGFSVKEAGDNNYTPLPDGVRVTYQVNNNEAQEPNSSGSFTGEAGQNLSVAVVCTNRSPEDVYELPETGGSGAAYTMAGVPLMAAAFCLWYKKRSQGEGAVDQ